MKNFFLSLICSVVFFTGYSQGRDTITTITPNKDTVLSISISKKKTFTFYDKTVKVVVKPYKAPPPVVVTPPVNENPPVSETPPASDVPNGYRLVYKNNFDKLSDLTTNNSQYGNGTVVNGTFYSVPANVSSGIRSELQISSSVTPTEGIVEWDAKYEVIVRDGGHSFQIHPNTARASASPGLWHVGGKFVIANWITPSSGVSDGYNNYYSTGFSIPHNTWNKYRLEYKMGKSGYMRFYVDGKKIFEKTGIQVGDGGHGYIKFGWNGWNNDNEGSNKPASSRIYIDNARVYEKVN